ncbi:hypothetical protein [Azohydromonas lata]|nr:hypothetical protein [Azohydromonas lata]
MAYLSESFLAASRLALGLPAEAAPRGRRASQQKDRQARKAEAVSPLRYPALMPAALLPAFTPPRSSAPGR